MRLEQYPDFADGPRGLYRHYKGNLYRVICLGVHSETLEHLVIYERADSPGHVWARPLSMWSEEVLVDGRRVPRFQKVEEE